ncbi:hypothetical protein ALI144C_15750 [Actinosynnema sp. ALI-1.44]|uniref:DUF4360 domain-containing protein n=1 Tax=Actinosynnema sp. ALI-1.44 TaxID=1933779 RepID=UPI00097C7AFF|nr:DUF4360 domain-containing protein [Actinosynnema sp. ALI-1.44]ONI84142.1 hypothetical protein ALI144C_15750 [Actinosynnema sp. ALI-1.44]
MITTMLALAVALSLPTPTATVADEVPVGRVTVRVVTANGSGCPVGSTEVSVADDNSEFTFTHREGYVAKVGPGADPTDVRKNCQLSLDVRVPSGFTFGIVRAEYSGRISLAAGAQAWQGADYYFQGETPTARRVHPFTGPQRGDWSTTDVTDPGSVVFAPCGEHRYFNVNTALRVSAGSSNPQTTTSWISMDSPDRNPNGRFRFIWKRC